MKAIFCTEYGPPEVLQMKEIERPVPRENDVLIKIYAATVTMGDCELRNLTLPAWTRIPIRLYMGYRRPKKLIPGMEFSGVVEDVGGKVTTFKKGDEVFGSSGMQMGAYAEYIRRPANSSLAIKPSNVTFEEVAPLIVGGLNALHFLKRANIQAGQKVLINGAGGSIGTFAVQLARLYGAEVTAVDRTDKLSMLRDIGADFVIDHTREDFTSAEKKYDVIFDVVYKSSFWRCVNSLKEGGCYLMANTGPRRMLLGLLVSWTSNKRIVFELAGEKIEDMDYLAELIASGKIKTVIDKTYTLDQVQAAHAYVEKGNKKGNVVIRI